MTRAVELREVHKSFGSVQALRGVSFHVDSGEIVSLLGPNGAGKTTAISIMLGLRRPTRGTATLFGMSPNDRRARQRVGVMLQESGVPATLTVSELVSLFSSYYPDPMPVARAIELAGLQEKASSQTAKLSGGQKQRLYFALAICGNPEVLFLDEPTVALDVEARQSFWNSIRDLKAGGKTIILTTHYLEEADQISDRVILIDRGVLIADDSPAAIKAGFRTRRVKFRLVPAPNPADFAGLPVVGLVIEGERARFETTEPEAVLRSLLCRGLPLSELEVAGVELEDAFLALTGSANQVGVG